MKIPKTPKMDAVMKAQRRAFKKKFGRYPKPGDPLFFERRLVWRFSLD